MWKSAQFTFTSVNKISIFYEITYIIEQDMVGKKLQKRIQEDQSMQLFVVKDHEPDGKLLAVQSNKRLTVSTS